VVEYYDLGSSVDLSTLKITIDGVDQTAQFTINSENAEWYSHPGDLLAGGMAMQDLLSNHSVLAEIRDVFNNLGTTSSTFSAVQAVPEITLSAIRPDFTIGGDTVTIVGAGFGTTVDVYFPGTQDYVTVQAAGILPGATNFEIKVPGSAITGDVFVTSPVGSGINASMSLAFTFGLPYAYIANRASHKITVMDYRDNTIQDSFTVPGTTPTPWAVDLTPDGRYLFIANFSTHNVTIAGTHNHADIINTVPLRCGTATPTNPRGISISPDGSRALVVSDNKYLSIIDVKKAVAGDTCSAVENKQYSAGTYFYDIALTPDVKHAIIPARTNPGQLLR